MLSEHYTICSGQCASAKGIVPFRFPCAAVCDSHRSIRTGRNSEKFHQALFLKNSLLRKEGTWRKEGAGGGGGVFGA